MYPLKLFKYFTAHLLTHSTCFILNIIDKCRKLCLLNLPFTSSNLLFYKFKYYIVLLFILLIIITMYFQIHHFKYFYTNLYYIM